MSRSMSNGLDVMIVVSPPISRRAHVQFLHGSLDEPRMSVDRPVHGRGGHRCIVFHHHHHQGRKEVHEDGMR